MLQLQDERVQQRSRGYILESGEEGYDGKIDMFCRPSRTLFKIFGGVFRTKCNIER